MEETDILDDKPGDASPNLTLTREAQLYLENAAKWAKFLATIGFICCGIILIFEIVVVFNPGAGVKFSPLPTAIDIWVRLMYAVLSTLFIIPSRYLYNFAAKIKKGIQYQESTDIAFASRYIKSFFKFLGVYLIISFALMIILIIVPIMFI